MADNETILQAIVRDAGGTVLGRGVAWSTNNAAVATVDGNGKVTSVGVGTAIITATTSEGHTDTSTVTVLKRVTSVVVTPNPTIIPIDATRQFTVTPYDSLGNALTLVGRTVTWGSSDNARSTVDGNGLATGVSNGPVVITATVDGVAGTASATVEALTLLRLSPGDNLAAKGLTFARSTVGRYRDAAGVIQQAAINVLRDNHYINGVRHILTEPSSTNYVTTSRTFSAALVNGGAIAAGPTTAPDGSVNAYRYSDDPAAGVPHQVYFPTSNPGSSIAWCSSIFVRAAAGGARWCFLRTHDGTTALFTNFDLLNGVIGSVNTHAGPIPEGGASHANAFIEAYPNGWYRIGVRRMAAVQSHTDAFYLGFAIADDTQQVWDGAGRAWDLWGAQIEPGRTWTTPIDTAGATAIRGSDDLEGTAPARGAMSMYLDETEIGGTVVARRSFGLGVAFTSPQWFLTSYGNLRRGSLETAGGGAQAYNPTAPVWLDRVESVHQFRADGDIENIQSLNGAAETTSGVVNNTGDDGTVPWSNPGALPGGPPMRIGSQLNVGEHNVCAWRKVIIATGLRTLAEMRSL